MHKQAQRPADSDEEHEDDEEVKELVLRPLEEVGVGQSREEMEGPGMGGGDGGKEAGIAGEEEGGVYGLRAKGRVHARELMRQRSMGGGSRGSRGVGGG